MREGLPQIIATPFRGSGAVFDPEDEAVPGDNGKQARLNKDFFANAKAQSWWHLRKLFRNTFRALSGMDYNPDEIISISSTMKNKDRLLMELSPSPPGRKNAVGKILVDKQPDGTKSPNLADSVMICYAPNGYRIRYLEKTRRITHGEANKTSRHSGLLR